MCGIAGAIYFGEPEREASAALERASAAVGHRGPDDHGTFMDGPAFLANRRLSIIDLSPAGRQPMQTPDGRFTITFNGEIYNFLELRAEFPGTQWRSNTDTEVILHAWAKWGADSLARFNGMFAFAIWDAKERELVLARDRFGVKPVHYFSGPKCFVFASEIKGILPFPRVPRDINADAVREFFTFGYIGGERTIYERIRKLRPGHLARVRDGRVEVTPWYTPPAVDEERTSLVDFGEACERLRAEAERAVRLRMIADVPLGAFLSGGLDSSAVVALMARQSSRPVKTYNICYSDAPPIYDESRYARAVARMHATDHHEIRLSFADVRAMIPQVLDHFDEPFADSSAIPCHAVSRAIREHVTVALSGDGGDEIFGGYRKYEGEYLHGKWSALPGLVTRPALALISRLPAGRANNLLDFFRRAKKFARGLNPEPWARHAEWLKFFPDDLLAEVAPGALAGADPARAIQDIFAQMPRVDAVNKMLRADILYDMPFDMLVKVDITSSMSALEVRSPFLDVNLVELMLSLPGNFKVKGRKKKHIMYETFKDLFPPKFRNRPKRGFEVPMSDWITRGLKKDFLELLDGVEQPYIDRDRARALLDAHSRGEDDFTFPLYCILTFLWWKNRYNLARPAVASKT